MGFVYYNPNPKHKRTSDCVVRAVARALNTDWKQAYMNVTAQGLKLAEMPESGVVWRSLLRERGFKTYVIPDSCPDCYTVRDFCMDHPIGKYVLAIGGKPNHVVTVVSGDWWDTWDCGDETPFFYMRKE